MKRRTLRWNVVPDDGGQALTEFVIVIPIVLLFFFAMVQYFSIVQATQLGNYAAFVAARVYAVSESCDTNAQSEAQEAASIVLAPIARPVPGEIGGDTSFANDVGQVETTLSSIGGTLGQNIYDFGSGYVMANYVRFNSSILGGSVNIVLTNYNSGPQQVDVNINYPQPVFIPGLASMWKFLGGTNIYASLSSQAQGLTGIPGQLLPFYAGNSSVQTIASELSQYDSSAGSSVQSFLNGLPTVILPYINIQSECAIGYSDWSGVPRLPDSIADDTPSDTNGAAQLLNQTQTDKTTYSNAVENATVACQDETNAYAQLLAAQQQAAANPTNSQAQANLAQAQATYGNFYYSNQTAQAAVTPAENNLNNDLSQLSSVSGNSSSTLNGTPFSSSSGGNSPPQVGGVNCPTCPPP